MLWGHGGGGRSGKHWRSVSRFSGGNGGGRSGQE